MRVALVDPYFITGMGYQTTGWFNAFVAKGHQVRAFSSCYVPTIVRHLFPEPFPEGTTALAGGELVRLPARQLPRDMVRCPGLLKEVTAFQPDLTLAIYPATLFALDLFRRRASLSGVLFSAFGENRAQRRGTPAIKRALIDVAFYVWKRRKYQTIMNASDVLLFQTPDTRSFLLRRTAWGRRRRRYAAKSALFALGFEPSVFHPDPEARRAERARLGFRDDEVVGLYSCKITPIKRLDIWVDVMAAAMRRVPMLRGMLVGIRQGHAESQRILRLIEQSDFKDRFICLPFASREELPRLYNAADFGVWYMQPSVTIQEAMGTGLYMLLTDAATVSHLVIDPLTGRYFREGNFEQLKELVTETAEAFAQGGPATLDEARRRRADVNAARFGYLALVDRLVAAADDLPNAVSHLTLEEPTPSSKGSVAAAS